MALRLEKSLITNTILVHIFNGSEGFYFLGSIKLMPKLVGNRCLQHVLMLTFRTKFIRLGNGIALVEDAPLELVFTSMLLWLSVLL